jgi:predicted permease
MQSEKKDDDLEREIRAHLELEAEERVADGTSADEARYAARRAFGNVVRVREDARAVWIAPWAGQVQQDLRYAARRLRRAPAFALTAIVILIAGIGLNLAFFQLLNVAVLRPLPVADLDTLVRFDRITKQFSSNGVPFPATRFIRDHNDVLSAVLTSSASDVVWGEDANDRLNALYVSANWFAELGYGAALGRVFVEAVDQRPDADPVIVVSYEFWRTRLQSEPVTGRIVRVNDRPATIAGVAPRGFPGLRLADTQIWLLIDQMDYFNPGMAFKDDWGSHNTQLYGRLKPGVSPLAAKDGLQGTILHLASVRPAEFAPDEVLQPYSGREGFRGPRDRAELRTITLLAGGLMFIVLLVACANLGNLVLSHAMNRLREFSLRAALGATQSRILRQQVVESALLTGVAAAGGLLAGQWIARFVGGYIPLPPYVDFTPDWRVVLATCAIAFIATMAIGFVPAWMVTRRDLVTSMKDGGHHTSSGLTRARFRLFSIAWQVMGCCVLLIVAGTTVRGLQRMLSTELGFEFEQVAVLDASLGRYGITGETARTYWDEVKRILQATPDVEHVALVSHAPLAARANRSIYNDAPRLSVTHITVEPSFFPLLRIPILAGRNFEPDDLPDSSAIISRRLAVEMYGTVDVLGKGFPRSKPGQTIIGIAADAPLVHVAATNVAEMYIPVARANYGGLVLLASARGNPQRLLIPMRDAARAANPRVLPKTSLPAAQFEERVKGRRVASLIASLTGALALSLACFGIFGLVAFTSTMRTREIGIRRALGAGSGSVILLLLRQLAIPVSLGMALGTAAGVGVGEVLEGDPFYLPAMDVITPAIALAVFALTAVSAAVVPAFRALGLDPLLALRDE